MTQTVHRNLTVLSLVSISLIGLALASMLLFYTPPSQDFPWRRQIVGSTYASICIFGAIAVFFPKKCSRIVCLRNWKTTSTTPYNTSQFAERRTTNLFGFKLTHGHHPNCEGFSDHEFQIGKKTFCAGCAGLLVGASISLVTVSAYLISQVQLDKVAIHLVGFGFVTVLFGLLTPIFNAGRSAIRIATNAFLILGMSSILVGADTLLHNIQIDLYLIALDILWLTTRISLSQLNHERICADCTEECVP
jgi:hypothetical protein